MRQLCLQSDLLQTKSGQPLESISPRAQPIRILVDHIVQKIRNLVDKTALGCPLCSFPDDESSSYCLDDEDLLFTIKNVQHDSNYL